MCITGDAHTSLFLAEIAPGIEMLTLTPLSSDRIRGSLETWLTPRLGWEIQKGQKPKREDNAWQEKQNKSHSDRNGAKGCKETSNGQNGKV